MVREFKQKRSTHLTKLCSNNKEKFWRYVRSCKKNKLPVDPNKLPSLASHFEKLFQHNGNNNEYSNIHNEIENIVKNKFNLIKNDIHQINITTNDISMAIDELKLGKSCGHNYISSEMLKYGNCSQMRLILQ